jgi:hypothetical protein
MQTFALKFLTLRNPQKPANRNNWSWFETKRDRHRNKMTVSGLLFN